MGRWARYGRIQMWLLFTVICGRLSYSSASPAHATCHLQSLSESLFGFLDPNFCSPFADSDSFRVVAVTEGDEVSLLKALNVVHKNSHEYVAVLFYASWCPFSRNFRPSFSLLSSLYPSILHLAIEESSVRPSILSKYRVHGFPTLFLLNSTMRVHYHGARTLGSLIAFYSDVTGVNSATLDKVSHPSNYEKHKQIEQENCPFPWARSPENWIRQETCLALATAFVLLRLLYLFFPAMCGLAQYVWRRRIQIIRSWSLLDHAKAYLNRVIQLCLSFKEPYRKRHLQEGSINPRAWASKSLATVSIGDASSSRGAPVSECH
ncbi:hypothetical protein K2173_027270 [Erythroxylum novogranatense]|uniref:Thioredoxin domain-containing protein n=1 Tax=Erythroxylum novogranatense TaxID=1862640 RepID=A0AAV8TYW3_9ROSI|nr:hypothetical protein K2173_027270 [Erythroxylum novogranatense]